MLRGSHGASPLARGLRGTVITIMRPFNVPSSAAFATASANMGTVYSKLGGRVLTQVSQTRSRLSLQKTWQPNHGIIFSTPPALGSHRCLSTSAAAEVEVEVEQQEGEEESNLVAHSYAEDEYVLASMESPEVEAEISETAEILEAADDATPLKASDDQPELIPYSPLHEELPKTTANFKMTEELFRAAKEAEQSTPESFWSHKLYRGPKVDGVAKRPTIHYCKSKLTMDRVLKDHFQKAKVIGFDIEWKANAWKKSGARQQVSLIQIASEDRIALFHLALFPKLKEKGEVELVTTSLKKILEDPEVTKCGVSIKSDFSRVRKYLGIHARGIFELSHLFRLVRYTESGQPSMINKKLVSLAKQVKWYLHLPMSKDQDVRSSDWSQPLSLEQITYAAADSYAGFQLYFTMDMKRKELKPTPPLPYHVELNLPIRLAEPVEKSKKSETKEKKKEKEIVDERYSSEFEPDTSVELLLLNDSILNPLKAVPPTKRSSLRFKATAKVKTKTSTSMDIPLQTQLLEQESPVP